MICAVCGKDKENGEKFMDINLVSHWICHDCQKDKSRRDDIMYLITGIR